MLWQLKGSCQLIFFVMSTDSLSSLTYVFKGFVTGVQLVTKHLKIDLW